ncbi:MAG: sulfite exporter TauE/SafE family protein [Candidatus Saganbacteria bacterium]|nr:sulfite exporter TauE/SafE family protein [Candidatus Saganbacteria bacterium]
MLEIFNFLSSALYSTPYIAVASAFVWGIMSIILSPCHLSSIPLIIGFISDQEKMTTRKAFTLALVFSLGILITIALIGLITGLMGRMLGNIGNIGSYFVAAVLIIIGLHLTGIISLPFFSRFDRSRAGNKKGLFAAFMLGLIFGIAMGPCTFAYLAPMLAIVFNLSSKELWYGMLLLLAYGIGHCSVIVFAGTSTESVQKYLNWNERSNGTVWIKKICGILLMIGGIYLIF